MKNILITILLIIILGALVIGYYYFQQLKKPTLLSHEQVVTSYCENNGKNQDLYFKNIVTSGQFNKIDRPSQIEEDECILQESKWNGGQLTERSCKGDVLIVEQYSCGYGKLCVNGACMK